MSSCFLLRTLHCSRKIGFSAAHVFADFLACYFWQFLSILGSKIAFPAKSIFRLYDAFFRFFSVFSVSSHFLWIWGHLEHKIEQKCRENDTKMSAHLSKKGSPDKPHHRPRHQLLTTSHTTSVKPTRPNELSWPTHDIPTNAPNWMGGRWLRLCRLNLVNLQRRGGHARAWTKKEHPGGGFLAPGMSVTSSYL